MWGAGRNHTNKLTFVFWPINVTTSYGLIQKFLGLSDCHLKWGPTRKVSHWREVRQLIEKAAEEGSQQRGPRLREAGDHKHQNGRPLVHTVGNQSCLTLKKQSASCCQQNVQTSLFWTVYLEISSSLSFLWQVRQVKKVVALGSGWGVAVKAPSLPQRAQGQTGNIRTRTLDGRAVLKARDSSSVKWTINVFCSEH